VQQPHRPNTTGKRLTCINNRLRFRCDSFTPRRRTPDDRARQPYGASASACRELCGIRESKGKSGDVVAAALKWSPSKISRYERAKAGLRPREVERLLDYYEITRSQRALLLGLAEDAAQKG
jgi:hypothetical protein